MHENFKINCGISSFTAQGDSCLLIDCKIVKNITKTLFGIICLDFEAKTPKVIHCANQTFHMDYMYR